ncbi:hypothetical protein DFA_00721 [Cavenderia fasciculata]|uniref:Uncharacterized protein n=1 Tax=Cavenderia fasciculata TaxID=261658 RepID=F4PTH4_CACFS|nr:uncharacterized protein DFA_00721 [Cavenderia fasciculata]EGG20856.1 hypothetical protein DFA_00721 [Cavenderia fasciculata]|eukprot:XP_004358706.1 hypothetical protein DFA_00721 [Cavenderia fasciculata]
MGIIKKAITKSELLRHAANAHKRRLQQQQIDNNNNVQQDNNNIGDIDRKYILDKLAVAEKNELGFNDPKVVLVPSDKSMSTWRKSLYINSLEKYIIKKSTALYTRILSGTHPNPTEGLTLEYNKSSSFFRFLLPQAFKLVSFLAPKFQSIPEVYGIEHSEFIANSKIGLQYFFSKLSNNDKSVYRMVSKRFKPTVKKMMSQLATLKKYSITHTLEVDQFHDVVILPSYPPPAIIASYRFTGINKLDLNNTSSSHNNSRSSSLNKGKELGELLTMVRWIRDPEGDWIIDNMAPVISK